MEVLEMSERTIYRALAALCEAKLLVRIRRYEQFDGPLHKNREVGYVWYPSKRRQIATVVRLTKFGCMFTRVLNPRNRAPDSVRAHVERKTAEQRDRRDVPRAGQDADQGLAAVLARAMAAWEESVSAGDG
jgi:hypothetical protein